jgi:alpha-beta hydrolase superfamily lysophospholipase
LPRTVAEVNSCKLCKAVNSVYFPHGSKSPAGVQIDGGHLTDDDSQADADTPDPAVPPGVPFTALVEDFDTAAHTNVGAPATVGDSSIIAPSGQPGGSRTIVITAAPGTMLHYICTIHPWMQATIIVLP